MEVNNSCIRGNYSRLMDAINLIGIKVSPLVNN